MYNPTAQVQVPTDTTLGSYFLKKIKPIMGVLAPIFFKKKTKIKLMSEST
jgi:hypothetical protein